jgi:hypothetical protein
MANDLWQCTVQRLQWHAQKSLEEVVRSPWNGGLHVAWAPIITIQVLLNDASHEFGCR